MKRSYVIFVLISLLLLGCATRGTVPSASLTNVDLSRKNYRIVKTNAMGESSGFRLLGIIPFGTPKPTEAMSDLYSKAGISEGKAIALVNVVHERSLIYLILFSIPKLTIRADIIEFLDEGEKK